MESSTMHPGKRVGKYKIRATNTSLPSRLLKLLTSFIMTTQKHNSDNQVTQNLSDFSIDHILNRAGSSTSSSSGSANQETHPSLKIDPYSWLGCTRYCPPKVPRAQKRDGPQKRQLGRHPRIPFTSHQLSVLEEKFQQSPYLSSEEVITLSKQLELADVRVKIWFQNRRARERREKMQNSPESTKKEHVNNTLTISNDISTYISSDQVVLRSPLENYFLSPINSHIHFTFEESG